MDSTRNDVILEGISLAKYFPGASGVFGKATPIRAVDNVSLQVKRGETLAIVGESGCGKSTLARLLLRLLRPTGGSVTFEGANLAHLSGPGLQKLRRDVQMIFQDPFASLNPSLTIGAIVEEPLWVHGIEKSRARRRERAGELLRQVGLSPSDAQRYPHEFSGGQRQRISIARALASSPKLILGDEPLSALDVSVQAQIINLLADLKDRFALTFVIVAHDLSMVRHIADRVAVMYLGEIVETGPVGAVFERPFHPYTQALLTSIPAGDPKLKKALPRLEGEPPSPAAPPKGCRFHTRCPHAKAICADLSPALATSGTNRETACHFWQDIAKAGIKSTPALEPSQNFQRRLGLFRERSEQGQTFA